MMIAGFPLVIGVAKKSVAQHSGAPLGFVSYVVLGITAVALVASIVGLW